MLRRRTVLASAAAALTSLPPLAHAILPTRAGSFHQGFLWGAATAAHQIEGNNTNSDCWLMENVSPTIFQEPSRDATNSLVLWQTDLDLVRNLGLNTYRFSLEWARIEPEPGLFSIAMLDYYKRLIEGCRERGLSPVVTFNHFTTPRWFAGRGGWHAPDSVHLFARYCDTAARHLSADISHAITLNEPNLAGVLHTLLPGNLVEGGRAMMEAAARAMGVERFSGGNAVYVADPSTFRANQLAAHRVGREAIKAVRGDLPVGVSLAMLDDQAVGRRSLRDEKRELYYNEWLRAARGDDFVGVQNYERKVWNATGSLPPPANAPRNQLGGEVYPRSLAGAVRYAHQVAGVPVLISEHGVASEDDAVRSWLIPRALAGLKEVMDSGVPVIGYIHWTLMDNFEWLFGYQMRFGLCSVDRATFARTPKPSAAVLGDIARRNSL